MISALRSLFENWFSLSSLPFGQELLTILSACSVIFLTFLFFKVVSALFSRFF